MTKTTGHHRISRLAYYSAAAIGEAPCARAFHYGLAQEFAPGSAAATRLHTNIPRSGLWGLPKDWKFTLDKVWLTGNVDNAALEQARIVLRRSPASRGSKANDRTELLVSLAIIERHEHGMLLEPNPADLRDAGGIFDLCEHESYWAELIWSAADLHRLEITKAPGMGPPKALLGRAADTLAGAAVEEHARQVRGECDQLAAIERYPMATPFAWVVLMGDGETVIV